jgi:hypothetical protein
MDLASGGILLVYLALKGAAYVAWCARGVRLFRPERARVLGLAVGLGLLRMGLGLGFGVLIFFAGAFVYAGLDEAGVFGATSVTILTYLAVYVPVRWIEWAILEALLTPRARSLGGFFLGADTRARSWRLGGALISCLADLPLMLSVGGLPVGRFMC